MAQTLYVTEEGFRAMKKKVDELEKELRRLQSQTADAAEVGGNQYHDNASYEFLLIQIRTADRRLSEVVHELNGVQVVQIPRAPDRVQIGTTVELLRNGVPETLHIVGYGEGNWERKRISYGAPLARLIIGAEAGATRRGVVGGELVTIVVHKIQSLELARE